MRPVFYEFPAALASSCEQPTQFMLGDQLLVAAGADLESPAPYPVCLPAGRWYDYWTGAELRSLPRAAAAAASPANPPGPSELVITATPALDRLPVFVRGGTILPRQPPVQSTAETPHGPLSLDVYPGEDCHGRIYLDDGHSMAYARGEFLHQSLRCELREDGLVIGFERREGSYRPWWHELKVTVHGWRGGATATIDDRPVAVSLAAPQQEVRVLLDDQPAPARLVIRHPVRQ
jgi:alpha-glucosidase